MKNTDDVSPSDGGYDFYSQYVANLRNIAEGLANAKLDIFDGKRKECENQKRQQRQILIKVARTLRNVRNLQRRIEL